MDYPGKVITKNQVTPTQTSATGVWTLDDAAAATRNNNWPVAGVPNPISKSLRFNSADTAYLNRTLSTGSTTTWTWSGWIKRSSFGAFQSLFGGVTDSSNYAHFTFTSGDVLRYISRSGGSNVGDLTTVATYRDPSAWYHVVVSKSGTSVLLYVNGVSVSWTGTTPTASDAFINGNRSHLIGQLNSANYLNGYLTEINFIDGQALTPSSFGMTDPVTGVWEPLKYSGTYGTNGFYLNFKDATSTTTLGLDYSGNSNNWTTNNFSVTAGAGNDSLTDVPTPWVAFNTTGDVGGVVRGNYCTLNPLASSGTFTNGNLDLAVGSTAESSGIATMAVGASGKYYWEVLVTAVGGDYIIGIYNGQNTLNPTSSGTFYGYRRNGQKYTVSGSAYGASYTTNDIIGVAVDMDAGTITFYKNGSSQGQAFSGISGGNFRPSTYLYNNASTTANFGQRPFAYTPPSGFLSLCTTNLPASTVLKGGDYFNPVLYTGNGSTQTITGLDFQPDWTWIKERSSTSDNLVQDAVRGVTKLLETNTSNAEQTATNIITSFNSNGFSLGVSNAANENTQTYVAWNWKANGAGVTNTAGSITSTVSANITSGFAVVTAAGQNNTSTLTIGHGLGAAPTMLIGKSRNGTGGWAVWHNALATNELVYLNSTAAKSVDGGTPPAAFTATSLTTFTVQNWNRMIGNGVDGVFYAFAPISGFSAFGSYTGNGSTDGPFVYLGFRPRWVMFKKSSGTSNWGIVDTARDTFNVTDLYLYSNLSNAEATGTSTSGPFLDVLSNGFKLRGNSSDINDSSATYIYACFAENPFKNALAR